MDKLTKFAFRFGFFVCSWLGILTIGLCVDAYIEKHRPPFEATYTITTSTYQQN